MTDAEKVLEFHVIKEKLAEYAYTRRARQEISQLKPYLSESELAARLRETSEARDLLEKAGNPPFPTLEGIEEFFAIAEKGGCGHESQQGLPVRQLQYGEKREGVYSGKKGV